MVEEQRGYDDTRALPQQSSMFGEHAEAPVVEPLFGSVEERQQEDERVAAVVVPARAAVRDPVQAVATAVVRAAVVAALPVVAAAATEVVPAVGPRS